MNTLTSSKLAAPAVGSKQSRQSQLLTGTAARFTGWIAEIMYRFFLLHPFLLKFRYIKGVERLRWWTGIMKAKRVHLLASRRVPAYMQLISEAHDGSRFEIPVTDKENYIKRFTIDERCTGGRIPLGGVVFDESSGSSGIPTNWVRCLREREENQRIIRFAVNALLPSPNKFIINAFALGPWATGMNISFAFEKTNILKSLGPDEAKIVNTVKLFGDKYHYIVMGYPPFLKNLADNNNIDWNAYTVTFIFGGEAMSEPMRAHILNKGIRHIYGSYGASDLDLNLAAENEFCINLRKTLLNNRELGRKMLRFDGAVPMIFQYNPCDFFMETTDEGELLVTVCRASHLAPKIRYNIRDLAQIIRWPELKRILEDAGIELSSLGRLRTDLPFLFHFGRADMAVAYYGCKVKPGDIQECLFGLPSLGNVIHGFSLRTVETESLVKKLIIDVELAPGADTSNFLSQTYIGPLLQKLQAINQDFRESIRMVPPEGSPEIVFHAYHAVHFAENDFRIKNRYIL